MTPEEEEELNRRAYLSLGDVFGKVRGEDHIARLLLSDAQIDPIVRTALGEALSPNGVEGSRVRLELTGLRASEFLLMIETRREWLKVGLEVLFQIDKGGLTRSKAEELVGEERGKGLEWVRKATGYAQGFLKWKASLSEEHRTNFDPKNLQYIFHVASVRKVSPKEHFADMIKRFEEYDRRRSIRQSR